MEGGEVYRISSARISSSNIWRHSARDIFSRSSYEEDDEEALKWAAIEKLPTELRLERGVLTEEKGQPREIDIKKLALVEKKNILERLVKIAEEDNEKFLLKLKERIDRVGLPIPTIEVRFEHLNVDAEAHVGGRAQPTIFNFLANMLEDSLNYLHVLPSRKKPFPILHDVSGIIKPGRMTLLLGPPSSGKTTLLLALAGKLGTDLRVSGRVTYNGHGMEEFVPQRSSAYISQHDLHIGELTVRETLAFSARALFMDEISTGLDSSTTFQIVNSIRQSIHILQGTSVISLLQPYSFVTVREFAEAFQSFHVGRRLGDELAVPFDKTKSHPALGQEFSQL